MEGVNPTLKPRTAEGYKQIIKDHLQPALGALPLTKLRPQHVQKLYASMLAKGRSAKTIANVGGLLHASLKQAQRWGLVNTNVASLVQAPRRKRPEMKVLSSQQVRVLLDAADVADDPYAAMWALALGTGMRQGEILGLRWPDVDMDRGRLTVQNALVRLKNQGHVLDTPKTQSSRRVIRLSSELITRLASHRSADAQAALQAGRSYDLKSYVFRQEDGQPVTAAIVLKAWYRALKRAGLPRLRFHDARHSVATILMDRLHNARVVADVLGHSDVSTTLRMYVHSTDTQHEQAAAILGEALG